MLAPPRLDLLDIRGRIKESVCCERTLTPRDYGENLETFFSILDGFVTKGGYASVSSGTKSSFSTQSPTFEE